MAAPSRPVIAGVVIGIVIIGCCWIWCWWWPHRCWFCLPCPDCPDCVICEDGVEEMSLVVQDSNTAVWMAMDNEWIHDLGDADHFVCDPEDLDGATPTDLQKYGACAEPIGDGTPSEEGWDTTDRPGVIFQTGTVKNPAGGGFDHLDTVSITYTPTGGSTDTITLNEGDFDWLDIKSEGSGCPIDALHAYSLFYDDPSATVSTGPDLSHVQVATECDGATGTNAAGDVLDGTSTCFRDRALHSSMLAHKDLITFWPDPGDLYRVEARVKFSGSDVLTEFDFTHCGIVRVDRWNEGCWQERYPNVTQVVLRYIDDSSTHGGFHNPPMDGGDITRSP